MPPNTQTISAKVITVLLVIATGISARFAYETNSIWAERTAIFIVASLPIILTAMWFKYLTPGQWLLDRVSIWHIRIFYLSGLFILVAYSNKWAGDYINDTFAVDPSHFGVSLTTLTVLFIPINLLYSYGSFITSSEAFTLIDYGVYATIVLFTAYKLWKKRRASADKKIDKIILLMLSIAIVASVFVITNSLIAQKFPAIAKEFMVWADFNEKHRCIDEWLKDADSVIFLGESKVLAHFNSAAAKDEFAAGNCTYTK